MSCANERKNIKITETNWSNSFKISTSIWICVWLEFVVCLQLKINTWNMRARTKTPNQTQFCANKRRTEKNKIKANEYRRHKINRQKKWERTEEEKKLSRKNLKCELTHIYSLFENDVCLLRKLKKDIAPGKRTVYLWIRNILCGANLIQPNKRMRSTKVCVYIMW